MVKTKIAASWTWHRVVWCKWIDIAEEFDASVVVVCDGVNSLLLGDEDSIIPVNRLYTYTKLHGVTSQKT
jgi:hypothetical protein